MVELLLNRKARIAAADIKGDTCLHIAMRARSRVRDGSELSQSFGRRCLGVYIVTGSVHMLWFAMDVKISSSCFQCLRIHDMQKRKA